MANVGRVSFVRRLRGERGIAVTPLPMHLRRPSFEEPGPQERVFGWEHPDDSGGLVPDRGEAVWDVWRYYDGVVRAHLVRLVAVAHT